MALTTAQNTTLKNDVTALSQPGQPLQALVAASNWDGVADFYNTQASPDFLLWRSDAPVADIFDAVDRSKYTPADVADATVTYTNRALAAQTKMMSLDGMLAGRTSLDATKATIRVSLRDATIAVPSGASGALTAPGGASGVNVLTACTRKANVVEKLLVSGAPVTTGTVSASIPGFVGQINGRDVLTAMQS